MKISSKIIAGYAILIILMAGMVAFELFAIHRMQSISRDLSTVNFRASIASLQLMRERDLVEEYTRKYFLVGDPQYRSALGEFQLEFENTLGVVAGSVRSVKEKEGIDRLSENWKAFKNELNAQQSLLKPGRLADFPKNMEESMERLRVQIFGVYQTTLAVIESEVQRSSEMGRAAESVTWIVAGFTLIVSCLVTFFITRSISKPLRHLTEGTNRIAAGQFDYRLDASRSDEFAHLARDFNTMTRRLNELDQMKKDFVSHVSHELKAPLSSMREALQLLLEELPGPLTAKQKRLLEINLQCSRRLSSMIGNLLDLSRMEAGMMEYELKNNDIVPLIQTTVAEFEPRAGEKGISLRMLMPEQPLSAHCDADRILQVLGNVLGNAIKFSPSGKGIEIRASDITDPPPGLPKSWLRSVAFPRGGANYILVEIADSGPGIHSSQRENIFERFQQVQQTKGLSGQGVGLGLAICRTIIQAHQGAIWVEENPGGGSIFSILLPAAGSSDVTHRMSGPI